MFNHEQIWLAIDRLAQAHGYSPSGLAKKAGLDPTSFNKSKRINPDGKLRWPSTESIAKILDVTGATASDLFALAETDKTARRCVVPLVGLDSLGHKKLFDESGAPRGDEWEEWPFNAHDNLRDTFAVRLGSRAFEPAYGQHDILFASPRAEIRRGDKIIIATSSGKIHIGRYDGQNGENLTLAALSLNTAKTALPVDKIRWMARIMWVKQ